MSITITNPRYKCIIQSQWSHPAMDGGYRDLLTGDRLSGGFSTGYPGKKKYYIMKEITHLASLSS
jgi:hypothetical protein